MKIDQINKKLAQLDEGRLKAELTAMRDSAVGFGIIGAIIGTFTGFGIPLLAGIVGLMIQGYFATRGIYVEVDRQNNPSEYNDHTIGFIGICAANSHKDARKLAKQVLNKGGKELSNYMRGKQTRDSNMQYVSPHDARVLMNTMGYTGSNASDSEYFYIVLIDIEVGDMKNVNKSIKRLKGFNKKSDYSFFLYGDTVNGMHTQ